MWLLLLVAALMLRRTRPFWTPVVPILAAILWFVTITVGEIALGWTA
jgi:hypothetical protein